MKKRQNLLSDEQWELIGPLIPEPRRRKDNRGRPWAANRACLESILWVLQTGAAWRFLPKEYPSPSTCWRRLKHGAGLSNASTPGWDRSTDFSSVMNIYRAFFYLACLWTRCGNVYETRSNNCCL